MYVRTPVEGLCRWAVAIVITLVIQNVAYSQKVAPVGGRGGERQKLGPILSNRPPVPVRPLMPESNERATYADSGRRLEVTIDSEHGSLKSLRFPALFEGVVASSIDRYIIFEGLNSSELDDEVIRFQSFTDSDVPHVVVDCLDSASSNRGRSARPTGRIGEKEAASRAT